MKLVPISERPDAAKILYQLLEERPEYANISHKKMPTWEEHLRHIAAHSPGQGPHSHKDWYIITDDGQPVGAIYLSCRNEIGVGVLKAYQSRGIGGLACWTTMMRHAPGLFLWNVNPNNERSIAFAEEMGFRLIQETYALEITA